MASVRDAELGCLCGISHGCGWQNSNRLRRDFPECEVGPVAANRFYHAVGIHSAFRTTAAQARRKYSSYSQEPLLPVCRVTTRSRLGTKAMSWPPEPGL